MMTATTTRRLVLAGGLASCLAPPAFAHKSKSVLTTISWNATRKAIEVEHRVHTADAEAGIAQYAGQGNAMDMSLVRNQARLLVYIEARFKILTEQTAINLQPVGVEQIGQDLLAYQDCELSSAPDSLSIDNQIFRDIFDQQTNLVNINFNTGVKTLLFAGRDGVKQVRTPT